MDVNNFDGQNDIELWFITDHKLCEECIWYHDCPHEYACPPLELLQRARE